MSTPTPLVSILCEVYNHETFLRDCLDGFLKQETNFDFEVLIHDDASTDKSAQIIQEYTDNYPNLFKPIIQKENQYSKGRSIWKTFQFPRVRGKYIAHCEGDDYWTDPVKLQKQIDFLESHPDYSMCFHNATVHYENQSKPDHAFVKLETREYQVEENVVNWIVPTASIVYRKDVLDSKWYREVMASSKFLVGDNPLVRSCGMVGKLYAFSDIMSVYRKQPGGWTECLNVGMTYKLMLQETEYARIFGKRFLPYSKAGIARHSRGAFSVFRQGHFCEAFKIWGYALRHAPIYTLRANIKFAFKLITQSK